MSTYPQITARVKNTHGIYVKSCWIAHVKEMCGLDVRMAWNRKSKTERQEPCPDEKVAPIKEALKYFKMF